jgi:transcriptional regulator with XRE-family HTH domain
MRLNMTNLLAALDAKGMNQKELAVLCGWSEAKASRLLNGLTGEITLTTIKELEAALGVKAAFLLDLEDVAQNAKEREMLVNYRKAQERDRAIAEAAVAPPKHP